MSKTNSKRSSQTLLFSASAIILKINHGIRNEFKIIYIYIYIYINKS